MLDYSSSAGITTGINWLDTLLLWASIVVVLGGAWAVILRHIKPFFTAIGDFLDEWNGSEERPGHPRIPGVVERLATVEYQVHNNGGHSLKDAVDRTELAMNEHIKSCDATNALAEAMPIVARSTPAKGDA